MANHTHQCPRCVPELVPDFDPADDRYHAPDQRHGALPCNPCSVFLDGVPLSYTVGAWSSAEGWALEAGASAEDIHLHDCPNGPYDGQSLCVRPLFGSVTVEHRVNIGGLIAAGQAYIVGERGPEVFQRIR